MKQISEEEANLADAAFEEMENEHHDDDDDVPHQHAGLRQGGGEEELTEQMQRDMVHFLNTTGQEADSALDTECKERRLDQDGGYYLKSDFVQYYNGLDEWKLSPIEKRLDSDGKPYSFAEFVQFYQLPAAEDKWEMSRPQVCVFFFLVRGEEHCVRFTTTSPMGFIV